ncbi:hypothetical protein TCAP_05041, partial [Tolypocladium capitatum]
VGRRRAAADVLGSRQRGGLPPGCVADYGFEVLVAALVGPPVAVAEVLVDGVDVELLDELLVRNLRLCRSGHVAKACREMDGDGRCVGGGVLFVSRCKVDEGCDPVCDCGRTLLRRLTVPQRCWHCHGIARYRFNAARPGSNINNQQPTDGFASRRAQSRSQDGEPARAPAESPAVPHHHQRGKTQ